MRRGVTILEVLIATVILGFGIMSLVVAMSQAQRMMLGSAYLEAAQEAMDIGDMRSHALGLDGVNMMSHDRAARSITIIDNAIDKVSTQRANLGAYQNRLEYTASNLTTASENLSSAESRIRDTDMAKEMMNFTKLNIMLQAGNSMLAQANQQPQNVLSLIR